MRERTSSVVLPALVGLAVGVVLVPRNRKRAPPSLAASISFCTALRTRSVGSRYEETVPCSVARPVAASHTMQATVGAKTWARPERMILRDTKLVRAMLGRELSSPLFIPLDDGNKPGA